jgi:hypothetical protein
MTSRISFDDWKRNCSTEPTWWNYRAETGAPHFQCFDLDINLVLFHQGECLFETDDLAQACVFIYNRFHSTGIECAVWQERTQTYRQVYKHEN